MIPVPVIAVDGPSASGKGTVAHGVAKSLGFHYLDSGALYRLVALAAIESHTRTDDEPALALLAAGLDVRFAGQHVRLERRLVDQEIRTETCSQAASKVALLPAVRAALLQRQRAFRKPPGLVAEGRDMGAVVFPDAELKIFLTATHDVRAERRHKQLIEKGIAATLSPLLQELRERDDRDAVRSAAPLKQCPDAHLLDTTAMSADEAVRRILEWYRGARVDRKP